MIIYPNDFENWPIVDEAEEVEIIRFHIGQKYQPENGILTLSAIGKRQITKDGVICILPKEFRPKQLEKVDND